MTIDNENTLPETIHNLWNGDRKEAARMFPKAYDFYHHCFPDFRKIKDLTEAVDIVRGLLQGKPEPVKQPEPEPKPKPVTPETFQPIYKKRVVCSPDCPICGGKGWINQYPLLAPDSPKRCKQSRVVMRLSHTSEMQLKAIQKEVGLLSYRDFFNTFPLEKEGME